VRQHFVGYRVGGGGVEEFIIEFGILRKQGRFLEMCYSETCCKVCVGKHVLQISYSA